MTYRSRVAQAHLEISCRWSYPRRLDRVRFFDEIIRANGKITLDPDLKGFRFRISWESGTGESRSLKHKNIMCLCFNVLV